MPRIQIKQIEPITSLKQIRQAIPKHCFQRSVMRSMSFAIRDIILLLLFGYFAVKWVGFELNLLTILFWLLYAYVQGTIGFGLFVVGHQCGHGAFSDYMLLNDIVGYILHSVILVPYFSWQRTHYIHHSKNNHLLDNQAHQPSLIKKSKQQYEATYRIFGASGFAIIQLMIHSAAGWLIYLFYHGSGSRRNTSTKEEYKNIPNHFSPFESNQLFPKQYKFKVFLSTLGNAIVVATLIYLATIFGLRPIILLYVGPYTATFAWLVIVTWLQHTEPSIPHLGQDQWNWLKGALMTIDRNYPWIIDQAQHHIGTTHVLHHIFPQIPHYHAVQATKAIIPKLGKHYRYDPSPITKVMWRLANQCHFIESLEGVQYYKSFIKLKREEKRQE